ncbi:MAG: efflux RND transporter periplasmic adaptor subunit [Pirellulaceae bacterium]
MKRGGIVMILAVLAVVLVTTLALFTPGRPVQVAEVRRGEIHEYIDERGTTRLPRVYRVTMPQAGRIEEVLLREGSRLKQGEIVARIISEDLENEVAEAQAVVERLDAAITENDDVAVETSLAIQAREFVESMNNTVLAAEAQKEASAKRSDFAETNLGRIRELRRSNASTQDELDRATLAYWEGQLGYRENTLTVEAMKSIRAATALLPQMVSDYISHKGLTRAVLEKQKAEAQARLRQVMTQRDRGTMRSPVEGVILQRLVENEQFLPAGTELVTIGQLTHLEVETDILSQDVVRIRQGNVVEVYGPAVGAGVGDGVPGTVHQIFPAGFTKISSLGVEQQRVKVIVRFAPDVGEKLRQLDVGVDYSVRVRIFTDRKAQALTVPRAALFRGPDGSWQLFAVTGKRAVLQTVTVGLINDAAAEIVAGLEEGQQVILAPDTNLTHGMRVNPIVR